MNGMLDFLQKRFLKFKKTVAGKWREESNVTKILFQGQTKLLRWIDVRRVS